MHIRAATAEDIDAIAIGNAGIALETENKKLDSGTVYAGVAAVFDDPSRGQYWVAEEDGCVIGQLMTTREWSDWRNGMLWWIQDVYVIPDKRRHGVFRALYAHLIEAGRADPECRGIRLYVERENEAAQRTYQAVGMTDPGYIVMQDIFDE